MKKLKLSVLLACVLSLFCGNVANAQMFRVYKNGEVVGAYAKPDSVVYVPATDPMEYVDLALPSGTKWASCNVGAQVPEDIGDYYQWGALKPIDRTIDWTDQLAYSFYANPCKSYDENAIIFFHYNKYNETDGKSVLDPEDDVATQLYGEGWQIPSREQNKELYTNTTITKERVNDVPVLRYTSKLNGKSIIMPIGGRAMVSLGFRIQNPTELYFWINCLDKLTYNSETDNIETDKDLVSFALSSGLPGVEVDQYGTWYARDGYKETYRQMACPVRPVYVPKK